ncbi:ABC transporter ATP-binding protein [Geotalea uraniireducens]|uniref:ABC transporter ATP-binding protein n=1 Tax=Geotalea uraniireducens TaxID=351604 RepID=A0ABN6VXG7_9BACT|nr:ABC transporter ATP-binding protein [Geotalea uraniireducens]BDV43140.1 ABC transporter ATP-binding protein [Geotalea uraniireducens]
MTTLTACERSEKSAIVIEHLTKTYIGKKRVRIEALKDISLSVTCGEVFGFLGPNGAGKSTTIKCLVGLLEPTKGHASIMGNIVPQIASRRNLGYLPENPAFYDYLSAEEYITFVGSSFNMTKEQLTPKCEEVLKLLGLWDARKRPMRSYSKGMVQRVGLAQVLVHDPEVYILDEPMSGLDPLGRSLVKDIICDLKRRGKTVFFSTHIIDDVEKICDRVGIILHGELQCVAKVEQIVNEGITGYQVRSHRSETGVFTDHIVSKEELTDFLNRLKSSGEDVVLVEPCRQHLEDFFLALVGKNKQST